MSHADNKIKWCLRKAEKELKETGRHRGLVKTKLDPRLIRGHIQKAEHNLRAMTAFRDAGYSDWSASAAFYAIYHCFLAIIAKHGFESRNQECTFALITKLIEDGEITIDKDSVQVVCGLKPEEKHESPTIIELRESQQYGVAISLETNAFDALQKTALTLLDETKEIIEE